MQEGVPGGAEHGHEVVAKTLAERELLLSRFPPSSPPFLLRVCLPDMWRWAAFRGRGIAPQSTGDVAHVIIRYPEKMYHDIPDVPEGTGTGRGPGVLWQGGEVL